MTWTDLLTYSRTARQNRMGNLILSLLLLFGGAVGAAAQQLQLPHDDTIRVREFYRLAGRIQDDIWPAWSAVPSPLLLVTEQREFLMHHPAPPQDFSKVGDDLYERARHYPINLLATFPAFGKPAVIVIGEPANTTSKSSTPWLITLMHEHFHQLQDAQPGYFEGVDNLGLSHEDKSGMWMLNYPFPYESPAVMQGFAQLRDMLLKALSEADRKQFARNAADYKLARRSFFDQLSSDDHKYLAFQLWQEGIARYTEIRSADDAAAYVPTEEYAALPDFESFGEYSKKLRDETIDELRNADIRKEQRLVIYPWGAAEGLLLDRLKPGWQSDYFKHPFSLDFFFEK